MDDKPVNYSEKRYKEIKDEHLSLVGEEKRGGPKAALKLFKQVDEKKMSYLLPRFYKWFRTIKLFKNATN